MTGHVGCKQTLVAGHRPEVSDAPQNSSGHVQHALLQLFSCFTKKVLTYKPALEVMSPNTAVIQ